MKFSAEYKLKPIQNFAEKNNFHTELKQVFTYFKTSKKTNFLIRNKDNMLLISLTVYYWLPNVMYNTKNWKDS
jgi:hypothetical protein